MTSLLSMAGYPAAIGMGLAMGLTGSGGAILILPILVYLFGLGALEATTYSLGLVGLVALLGAWNSYRAGDLRFSTAAIFGFPSVVGVLFSRKVLLPALPESLLLFGQNYSRDSFLLLVFAILMILAAFSMFRNASPFASISKVEKNTSGYGILGLGFGGLLIGSVAGFVGSGGGFLMVPALIHFGKFEFKMAVGTSLTVIALQSLIGFLSHQEIYSTINYGLFFSVLILAFVGLMLGIRLRRSVPIRQLRVGFGIFILIMAVVILAMEIPRPTQESFERSNHETLQN